ncbi:hypothetical protein Dimus_021377 [Dionaea muscipula]
MTNVGQPAIQTPDVSTASATSTSSSKISLFRAKPGFVIPKNKLSGSLVPTFRGVKKPEGSDAANEQSIKESQRKTRWGADLMQDASVRRGRALAYQTRVEQITRQLKSGSMGSEDDQNDKLVESVSDPGLSLHQTDNQEKVRHLEVEKQEVIGEILKLNPSYKAPSDYKPSMKEDFVPLPVKEHPGYNFVSLVFGPGSDTQKRLEKEIGARIQVYGTKSKTGEKVELKAFDGSQLLSSYDEMHVQISADSYEKIDSAVALIELLVSSVSGKPAASNTSAVASGDNVHALSEVGDTTSVPLTSVAMPSQGMEPPGSMPLANSQGQFQPFGAPWLAPGPPHPSPGLPPPNVLAPPLNNPVYPSPFPFNSLRMTSPFGPRVGPPTGVGSGPPTMPSISPLSQPSMQVFQRPFMPQQVHPFGQISSPSPRNPSPHSPSVQPNNPAPTPPFTGHQLAAGQPMPSGSLTPSLPHPHPHPLGNINIPLGGQSTPVGSSMGWAVPVPSAGSPLSQGQNSMVQTTPPVALSLGAHPMSSSQPMIPSTQSLPTVSGAPSSASPMISRPLHGPPPFLPQIRSSSAMPILPLQPFAAPPGPGPLPNLSLSTTTTTTPPLGPTVHHNAPQSGMQNSVLAPVRSPSFTPLNSSTGVAPRPQQQPGSGDFTFQPHRPPAPPPPPQSGGPPSLMQLAPARGTPAFRPALQQSMSPQSIHPWPPIGNQMGQQHPPVSPPPPVSFRGNHGNFGNPIIIPQVGSRNPGSVPQLPNTGPGPGPGPSFPPPRAGSGSSIQFHPPGIRPGNVFAANQNFRGNATFAAVTPGAATTSLGGQQVYDPFSPTSVSASSPQVHGSSLATTGKQDNDPEYEDLMASVGVK